MKVRNPIDRNDLKIRKKDNVLEVGGGHNPSYRANTIVDKFVNSNYHRGGGLKKYSHQTFINANGENLPFKDKEFDYVICNQVLEHVDNPVEFVKELARVGKRGYLETPSLIGESLFPKESHKWVVLEIDGALVLFAKEKMKTFFPNLGITFLNYLPYKSIALRLFYFTNHQVHTVRYEWDSKIDVIVNPIDEKYSSFFTQEWDKGMTEKIFPPKSRKEDILKTIAALIHLVSTHLKRVFIQREKLQDVKVCNPLESSI